MRNPRAKLLAIGLTSLSPLLALAACGDSIHLDPPKLSTDSSGAGGTGSGGGSASSSSSSSGAGGANVACISNSDCPAPTAVCDTAKGECVECLHILDCGFRPGTVCSEGSCVCPAAVDSFCPASAGLNDRCVNLVTSSTDCGSCNHPCFGACNNGVCADPWEPTATANAPSPRQEHVAVWASTRMIVWGGLSNAGYEHTGGTYDPATRTWQSTSLVNVPSPRSRAAAVWTDTAMVVWGGFNGGPLGTGGIFNPTTNTWKPISMNGAPSPRWGHTAVWTGQKVLVWGGFDGGTHLNTGAQYDPATDAWSAITTNNALSGRQRHTAVWTGAMMIVYGGFGFDVNTNTDNVFLEGGSQYDPAGDTWTALSAASEPSPRADHTAVWTGTEMLVWGGDVGGVYTADGAKYSLQQNAWTPMNGPFPVGRHRHTALWMTDKMIIWGGNSAAGLLASGGRYNPLTNSWDPKDLPTALSARQFHTVVAAGPKMLLWGGATGGGYTNTGGLFDPAAAP